MKANQVSIFSDKPDLQREFENIYQVLNKIGFGVSFTQRAENLDMYLMQATANSIAGQDTNITHDLKRIPIGYLILSQNASGDFYEGTGTSTSTSFFIRCSTASTRFKIALL